MLREFLKDKGKVFLCAVFCLCAILISSIALCIANVSGVNIFDGIAYAAVSGSGTSASPYVISSANASNDWTEIVRASRTKGSGTVTYAKLGGNWVASGGSFGNGEGFGTTYTVDGSGCILVPSGANICLDLAGFNIDRHLTAAIANGQVIYCTGILELRDSSSDQTSKITGGFNSMNYRAGGIVAQGSSAKFTLTGGNIYENRCTSGDISSGIAGVFITDGATFNMKGGAVEGNIGGSRGGVYMRSSIMNYTGGKIIDNIGGTSAGQPTFSCGGLRSWESTVNISGSPQISGNIAGATVNATTCAVTPNTGTPCDVNLYGAVLTLTGKLNDDASLGVTTTNAPTASAPVKITKNYGKYHTDGGKSTHFVSNGANTGIGVTGTGENMERTICVAYNQTQWATAVAYSLANKVCSKVTLTANWTAASGSFGTSTGTNASPFGASGAIMVPAGANMQINLNNFTINRGLTSRMTTGGHVIYLLGTLEIMDLSTTGGGKVTGGFAGSGNNGGGVSIPSGGKLTLSGGNIYGNKAYTDNNAFCPGGVFVAGGATFVMKGGRIENNISNATGGVHGPAASAVYLYGGTITGNVGGTSIYSGGGMRTTDTYIKGSPQLYNNKNGATVSSTGAVTAGTGYQNDIRLTFGTSSKLTIVGKLSDARIGVINSDQPIPYTFTTGYGKYNTEDPSTFFFSNGTSLGIEATGSGTSMEARLVTATTSGTTTSAMATAWTAAVTDSIDNKKQVYFKLSANWTASSQSFGTGVGFGRYAAGYTTAINKTSGTGSLIVPNGANIVFDLNGYSLNLGATASGTNTRCFFVQGTLTITDTSTAGTGKVTGGYTDRGAGVYVTAGGTLNLISGSITGNTAFNGAGVYVYGQGAVCNMSGGKITNNRSTNAAPAIHVWGGSKVTPAPTFNMTGGEISGNTGSADNCTGAVGVDHYSEAHISGGTITNNKCGTTVHGGGGLGYVNDINNTTGVIYLSGNPKITGNFLANGTTTYNYNILNKKVYFDGPMTAGASIGIRVSGTVSATAQVAFTSGYSNKNTSSPLSYFTSDNSSYKVGAQVNVDTDILEGCIATQAYTYLSRKPTAGSSGQTLEYTGYPTTLVSGVNLGYMSLTGTTTATDVGNYETTVTPATGCYWPDGTQTAITVKCTITARDLSTSTDIKVTVTGTYTYTGTAQLPTLTVTDSGVNSIYSTLTSLDHYTLTNLNNTNASTSATVTLTGKGNYRGSRTITFTINKSTITAGFTNTSGFIYNGVAQSPTLTITVPSTVTANKPTTSNFTLSGRGTNKGDYTVTATLAESFRTNFNIVAATGSTKPTSSTTTSVSMAYSIGARSINDASVTYTIAAQTYSNAAKTPAPTVKFKTSAMSAQSTLVKDTDYTVGTYTDNTNAGTGHVVITGTGNFTGTRTLDFTINKANLSSATLSITTAADTIIYKGSAWQPAYTATLYNLAASDYTAAFTNNTNAGTATLTITANSNSANFTGSKAVNFTIKKATLTDATSGYSGIYDRAAHRITVAATGFKGSDTFANTATVTYSVLENGTYGAHPSIINVADSKTVYYRAVFDNYETIEGSASVSITQRDIAAGTTINVTGTYTYTSAAQTPEYSVTNANLQGTNKTLVENTAFTAAYTNNINAGTNTAVITLTGRNNFKGTVTQRFTIRKATLTDKSMGYSGIYDRIPHGITVSAEGFLGSDTFALGTVTYGEASGTYDKTECPTATNVSENGKRVYYKVTFDNYNDVTGSKTIAISQRDIGSGTTVSVSYNDPYVYNAQAQTPDYAVENSNIKADDKTLVPDRDFTAAYTNNVNAGENTAVITLTGTGNFKGTKTQTFTIKKAELEDVSEGYEGTYDRVFHPITVAADGFHGDDTLAGCGTIRYGLTNGTYDLTVCPTVANVYNSGRVVYYRVTFDNYETITGSRTIVINQREISEAATVITVNGEYVYTSEAITPDYNVVNNSLGAENKTLVENTAFTAAYTDNIDAGTATITLTGMGNFKGTVTKEFTIKKAQITAYGWDFLSYEYKQETSRQPKISSVTTSATKGLPDNVADMFDYSGAASDAGSHTATAVLKDEYAANYEISSADDKKTVSTAFVITTSTLVFLATAYAATYDGKKHRILTEFSTKDKDDRPVAANWYWSENNIGADGDGWNAFTSLDDLPEILNVSETKGYFFKIEAAGFDTVIITRTPTVTPKSLGTGGNPVAGITYTDITDQTYDGTAKTPTTVVTDDNTLTADGGGITTADYEFSYRNNIAAGEKSAVLIISGKGNYSGSFQILYTINPRNIASPTIFVTEIVDKVFSNTEMKLSPTVTDTVVDNAVLAENTDYTVRYEKSNGDAATDFTNVGDFVVIIEGKGNYGGTVRVNYSITPKDISEDGAITVADIASLVFTGELFTPEPAVTTTFGSDTVTLVKDTDIEYAYSDNRNVGTASVTVSGKNNYMGAVEVTFEITPKLITSVSGITADGKVYDGTLTYDNALKEDGDAAGIHYDTVVIDGNVDGADLIVSTATGVFGGKDSGTQQVTVTVTALGGDMAGNYRLPENGIVVTIENVVISQREIKIDWGELEHVYDGKSYVPSAAVGNLVEGDEVVLWTRLDPEGSAVVPGNYTARIYDVTGKDSYNYKLPAAEKLTTLFAIVTENTSVRMSEDSLKVTYDGNPKLPVMEQLADNLTQKWEVLENDDINYTVAFEALNGGSLTEVGGVGLPVHAGSYKVTVTVSFNYIWSDLQPGSSREFTMVISPATAGGMTLGDATYTYSGEKFAVEVDWSGVTLNGVAVGSKPAGIDVVYFYDGLATDGIVGAGNHTVTAKFNVNGDFNAIPDITVNLVIEKAVISLDGVSFDDSAAQYDGNTHRLTLGGTLDGKLGVVYAYIKDGVSHGSDGVSEVGVYNVTATVAFVNAADGDNYKIMKDGAEVSVFNAVLEITKQAAEISGVKFNNATVIYDGNVHRLLVSGEAEGVERVTYEYIRNGETVSTDGVKAAGVYTVVATFTVGENYSPVAPLTATLTIGRAPLTVTADDRTITYGDNPATATLTASYSGLAAGDDITALGTLTVRVNGDIYSIFGGVGTYEGAIEASGLNGAAASNYNITYVSGALTVKPRVVEVAWYNDIERTAQDLIYTYSAGTVNTPYASVTNAVNGNSVFVTVEGGQENAGRDYVARATGLNNKNYTLPVNGLEVRFSIIPQPKSGVIIWSEAPIYYNGEEQAPKAYYYESENSYTLTELKVTVNRKAVNAGTYVATASLGDNYDLKGDKTKTFEIKKRVVYVRIGDLSCDLSDVDVSKTPWTYADGSAQFVAGEAFNIVFSVPQITGVGKYPVSASFVSNNSSNYEVHFVGGFVGGENDGKCGTLTVSSGVYDMTKVRFTGTQAVYDGEAHNIGVSGLPAGVTARFEYVRDGWSLGSDGVVDAGEYTVIVRFTGDNPGFAKIADMTVNMTVRKAALTVKANDFAIVYGDLPANGGVTYSIAGIENSGKLSGTLVINADYTQYGNAGKYRITPSGLTSDNYEITFVPGTLTVSPREIGVKWYADNGASSTLLVYDYDGNEHLPFPVAEGTLQGDAVTFTVKGAGTEAGIGYTAEITGVSNGNYTVKAGAGKVTFDIIRKNYVTWDNAPLVYNGENQAPKAYYFDGEGNRQELTVTVTTADGAYKNANVEYTATADVPAGVDGSREFKYTIAAKKLDIKIGNGSLVYGEVESNLAALLAKLMTEAVISGDGFIAADGVPVNPECNIDNTSAAGVYKLTAVCTNGNYEVTFELGSIEITKANVDLSSVTFGDATVEYDGALHSVTAGNLPAGIEKVVYTYYKNGAELGGEGVVDAGVYTVTAKFVADANHNGVETVLTATLTVEQADLNGKITFNNKTVTYNGEEHRIYVTGSMQGIAGVTYTYADGVNAALTGARNAGTYTVTATFAVDGNYKAVSPLTATLTVERAQLKVKAGDGAIVYGQTPSASGYGIVTEGLASGDNAAEVLGTLTFTYGDITGAGEFVINVNGAAQTENYTVTYEAGTLIVSPYTLTAGDIVWLDAENGNPLTSSGKFQYVYAAGQLRQPYAEVNALINGETVTLTVSGGKVSAGYGYVAEITAISGEYAANYLLPAEALTVIFDILPQPVAGKIIWDYEPLYYNGKKQSPKAYYFAEEGGDRYSLPVIVRENSVDAGTYTAEVDLDDMNYTLTGETSVEFKILPRPVYVVIDDVEVSYGENVSPEALGYTIAQGSMGFVNGEKYNINFLFGHIEGVGKYPVSGQFVCDNAANYAVTFTGSWASAGEDNGKYGTLTVVKAVYDMSGITFAGAEATYDGKTHKLIVNGLPEGVTAECDYVLNGFGYGDSGAVDAGVYTVTVRFTGDENYEDIASVTTTLTVKKASLIVKATDGEIIYGESATNFGVTYRGFADGENESKLTGTLEYAYSYTNGGDVGDYTITPYGLSAVNYEITFRTGTLRVAPRPVTVVWYDDETESTQSFVYYYDEVTAFVPHAVAEGLVNGDTVILTVEGAQVFEGLNYTARVTGVSNKNYTLPVDGSGEQTFNVMAPAYYVMWDNTPLYYNGEHQAPKAYYFDESGVRHDLVVSVTSGQSKNVGTYGARATASTDDPNRDRIRASTTLFDILKLKVEVVIDSLRDVRYGGTVTIAQNGWDYAEGSARFAAADGNPVVLFSNASAPGAAVGRYSIEGECTNANYEVVFTEGYVNIVKAQTDTSGLDFGTLTVGYDGRVHAVNVSGLPDYVTAVCTYVKDGKILGNDGVIDAGVYTVKIDFVVSSGNYEAIDGVEKTLTILKATADISGLTFGNGSAVYDGTQKEIFVKGTAAGLVNVNYTYYLADGVTEAENGALSAGTYKVKAEFAFDGNHDASATGPLWAELTVEKATLTVTANDGSVVYGEAAPSDGFGYTAEGLAAADDLNDVTGTLTFGYGAYRDAGAYDDCITVNGNAGADNYEIVYVSGTLTITLREITASWQKSQTDTDAQLVYTYEEGKVYLPYAVAGNVAAGDTLVLTAEVARDKSGDDYVAYVTGIFLGDGVTAAANYKLPASGLNTTFKIEYAVPVEHEIIWNYGSLYYNGASQKPTASYYDGAVGAYITLEPAYIRIFGENGEATNAVNAGRYRARITDEAADLFTNSSVEFEFTVLPRKVYITISDLSVNYGVKPDMRSVGWTYFNNSPDHKFIDGDEYTLTFTCGDAENAGKYAIAGEFGGNGNYEVIFTGGSWLTGGAASGSCGTLTVNKAEYDMTGVAFSGTQVVYDGLEHGITVSGLPEGLAATFKYVRNGVEYAGATNAGIYNVTVTFSGDGNHEAAEDMLLTLTVKKASLTVKAGDSEIVYGAAPKANGVTYSGFVNGENENTSGALGGAVVFGFGYAAGEGVGTYKITPAGLTSDNYDITFVSGVLTVKKRTVSVTWYADESMHSRTLRYNEDGLAHLPHAEAGNLVAGDGVVLTVTGAQTAAGINYRAEIIAISNSNYCLPENGTFASFDIIPEAYVIVWECAPLVYNGNEQAPTAYYYTANGEQVQLDVRIREGSAIGAGTYHAVASLRSGTDITLSGESVREFTIAKRVVNIVINDAGSMYGEQIALSGWKYGEGSDTFVSGEPVYLSCAATATSAVGKYAITGVCTDNDNYEVTFTDGVYTVEKAVIYAPELSSKVYTGERLTADIPSGRYIVVLNDGGINAGTYRVVVQLLDYMNTRWSGTALAAITLEFEITKAQNEWTTEFEVRGSVIAGGGNIYYTRPEPKFGSSTDVVIRYYRDASCENEISEEYVKTQATQGTYYAKVTLDGNDNYNGLESVYAFNVSGTLSIKLNWTNRELVYNGEAQAPVAYVWVDGKQVLLSVSGSRIDAGTYEATTDMRALDGTDLSGYVLDDDGEPLTIEYTIRPRSITVRIDDDAESIYGTTAINLNRLNWTVTQGSVMSGDTLGITFGCEVHESELAEAGQYPIIASYTNTNYNITFRGSWNGDDEYNGAAATYTVRNAQINVSKNSTTWFDEDGVIDRYQNYFITLGECDENGEYRYISLKGSKTAKISYSVNIEKYNAATHDNMSIAQIMQMFESGEQDGTPEIKQAGSWVVYYRIEAESHDVKYGIWKVQIEPKDKYVTVTFLKPYTVTYGDTVKGKNLLPELLDGGYIELGGAFGNEPSDYEDFKILARAYAYEDVTSADGYVGEYTGVNRYTIRLNFTEAALSNPLYANLQFKYSATNEPNSDTNIGKYEIARRTISVEWGERIFEYDGNEHIPSVTLKGFVTVDGAGAVLRFDDLKAGETRQIELANGDLLNISLRLFSGTNAVDAGTFGVRLVIDNANYMLEEDGDAVTVTITEPVMPDIEPEGINLPIWAVGCIGGGAALFVLIIAVLAAVLKKRPKGALVAMEGGAFDEDGFMDDYDSEDVNDEDDGQ